MYCIVIYLTYFIHDLCVKSVSFVLKDIMQHKFISIYCHCCMGRQRKPLHIKLRISRISNKRFQKLATPTIQPNPLPTPYFFQCISEFTRDMARNYPIQKYHQGAKDPCQRYQTIWLYRNYVTLNKPFVKVNSNTRDKHGLRK